MLQYAWQSRWKSAVQSCSKCQLVFAHLGKFRIVADALFDNVLYGLHIMIGDALHLHGYQRCNTGVLHEVQVTGSIAEGAYSRVPFETGQHTFLTAKASWTSKLLAS